MTQRGNAIEKGIYYLHFPREGACHAMQDHIGKHQVWSGDRETEEKARSRAFIVTSVGIARQSRVNSLGLCNLNISGVVSSCLLSGFVLI